MNSYKSTAISICMGVIICQASLSMAQGNEQPDSLLEEVIVIANKLGGGTTVQELPSAVTLFSGDELQARGAVEFGDLVGSIPGMQFQDLGPGDKEYIIRGTNSSGPSTVGIYFDETPITGSNAQDGGGRNTDIKLVDVERIEVLNGPQGTQYGANSMSGLVRYVSVKPDTLEWSGFVDLDRSGTTNEGGDNLMVSGAVNIPVIENKLAVRVTGWTLDNDGWIDQRRAQGGPRSNINDEGTDGGRVALRFTPTDALTADLSYITQEMELGGSSRFTPQGVTSFGDVDSGFGPVVAGADFENTDITQSPWDEDLDIVSATLSYSFDAGIVTATISQFEREIDFSFDSSPILFFFEVSTAGVTREPQARDIRFAELRFASTLDAPVQFLVGYSIQEEDNEFQAQVVTIDTDGRAQAFIPGTANDALANPDGTTFFGRFVENELDQSAFFGELSWDLNARLAISIGGRYFRSDQESLEGTIHDFGSAASAGPFSNDAGESEFTGKASVSFEVSNQVNLYGTVSQGFRVGGLNNSESLFVDDVPISFGPDKLTNYEVGAKSQFNNGASLNAALFHIAWEDIQLETVAGSAFPYITNAGEAEIDGLELDYTVALHEHWNVQIGGSYTDAKLTEDQPAVDAGEDRGFKGDRIPNVPRWQGFASLEYHTELAPGALTVRADLTYRGASDIRFDTDSANNYALDAYTLVNTRIMLALKNDWHLAFYGKNITDEDAEYDAISSNQDPLAVIAARPRTFGISVRKKF